MNTASHRKLTAAFVAIAATLILAACMSMAQLHGQPGADLSAVRVGASRAEVEGQVGAPLRQWITTEGVEYRLYRYDWGVPGDPAAIFLVTLEVLTLGLPSLMEAAGDKLGLSPKEIDPKRLRNLAVAYDRAGTVLGIFIDVGDFASLPADGRLSPRR